MEQVPPAAKGGVPVLTQTIRTNSELGEVTELIQQLEEAVSTQGRQQEGRSDELFKPLVEQAGRLSQYRKEMEAICKLNYGAALISGGKGTDVERGKLMLEDAKTELGDMETTLKPKEEMLLKVDYNLGLAQYALNEFREASKTFKKVSEQCRKLPDTLHMEKNCLEKLLAIGENGEAQDSAQSQENKLKENENMLTWLARLKKVHEKIAQDRQETDNDHQHHLQVLCQLADLYLSRPGNTHNAVREARDCWARMDRDWGRVAVSTCNYLGLVFVQCGPPWYDKAIDCFRHAELCEKEGCRDEEIRGFVHQNMGAVHIIKAKKEDFETAIIHFIDALEILERSGNYDPERRAQLYLNLGFAWSQLGYKSIWKAYEAYLNAGKCADMTPDSEERLRRSAYQGVLTAAMMIEGVTEGGGEEYEKKLGLQGTAYLVKQGEINKHLLQTLSDKEDGENGKKKA